MNALAWWLRTLASRFTRTLDLPLLAGVLALMGIGLAVLHSAAGGDLGMVLRQAARFGLGLGVLWLVSRAPVQQVRHFTPLVFALCLLPLVAVLFIGGGKYGNHWINLGMFYFQPSELFKVALPMMVAWYLQQQFLPPNVRSVLTALAIIALPVGLILLQKDFGTAVLVLSAGAFALFLAGLPWWWLAAAAGSLAALAPAAWFWFLRPYQKGRVLTYLEGIRGESSDPLGEGWNIIQSKIAIGSGGLTGKGWGQGSHSRLDYLPEHTTDFIFSVLSEEFGWIGVAVVLALYLFVIGRCLWIAGNARDGYARLLAGSLGLALFVYVIVNGGMVSGLLPVVGVPMPLLSYGGTSALSLLAGLGLVMSVQASAHRR